MTNTRLARSSPKSSSYVQLHTPPCYSPTDKFDVILYAWSYCYRYRYNFIQHANLWITNWHNCTISYYICPMRSQITVTHTLYIHHTIDKGAMGLVSMHALYTLGEKIFLLLPEINHRKHSYIILGDRTITINSIKTCMLQGVTYKLAKQLIIKVSTISC